MFQSCGVCECECVLFNGQEGVLHDIQPRNTKTPDVNEKEAGQR